MTLALTDMGRFLGFAELAWCWWSCCSKIPNYLLILQPFFFFVDTNGVF